MVENPPRNSNVSSSLPPPAASSAPPASVEAPGGEVPRKGGTAVEDAAPAECRNPPAVVAAASSTAQDSTLVELAITPLTVGGASGPPLKTRAGRGKKQLAGKSVGAGDDGGTVSVVSEKKKRGRKPNNREIEGVAAEGSTNAAVRDNDPGYEIGDWHSDHSDHFLHDELSEQDKTDLDLPLLQGSKHMHPMSLLTMHPVTILHPMLHLLPARSPPCTNSG
ncbi:hypothetical protein V2J09_015921 [Rumex salicifolius]